MTRCLKVVHDLEKDNKHVTSLIDVDEEIVADRKKAAKAMKALSKVSFTRCAT